MPLWLYAFMALCLYGFMPLWLYAFKEIKKNIKVELWLYRLLGAIDMPYKGGEKT